MWVGKLTPPIASFVLIGDQLNLRIYSFPFRFLSNTTIANQPASNLNTLIKDDVANNTKYLEKIFEKTFPSLHVINVLPIKQINKKKLSRQLSKSY